MRSKKVLFMFGIIFLFIGNWIDTPQIAAAQEIKTITSPSAIIDFEDKPVCVFDGKGYYNTERKAKITIIDESKYFDENRANKGIQVSRRDANGQILSVSSENVHIGEWVHRENMHIIEIVFEADGNYEWELTYTNLAEKKLKKISTGKSETPFRFTIDRETPIGEIQAISMEGIESTWERLEKKNSVGIFSKEKITVTGNFRDDTDETKVKVFYHKVNGTMKELKTNVLTKKELDAVSNWKEFDQLKITKDQSTIIYFKLVDRVGNYTYINTDVLTIDRQKPVIEKFVTQIDDKAHYVNGIFNDDVPVLVKVADPMIGNTFTGIKMVSYQVFNMGLETQSGILYDISQENWKINNLFQHWQGKFTVNSQLNNSNNVVVSIHVQDVVGNVKTESIKMKIDISEPIIHISYDNNDVRNKCYFSNARIATIVIQERNFNPDDVLITIMNSKKTMPQISEWVCKQGSGNRDNTEWIIKVNYIAEGDYIFNIKCFDFAGNKNKRVNYGISASPEKFTIDKTYPRIRVSYDMNEGKNLNYYNKIRTATIEVEEHNLDLKDIKINLVSSNETEQLLLPKAQDWKKKGDYYVTNIVYEKDGTYEFDIEVLDQAGNKSQDYVRDIFHIDMVCPSVEVIGVAENSSNNGDICLEVFCIDENYSEEQIEIKWRDIGGNEIKLDRKEIYLTNGIQYVYENIPKKRCMDNKYEVSVSMKDMAGNCIEQTVCFSVNRFGSSYQLSEDTKKINHDYMKKPTDVVIRETNVDRINQRKIFLFKNGMTILLKEKVDYWVELNLEDSGKYQYTYTIFKENFKENGIYEISICSEDAAGNISYNNIKGTEDGIRFGVDTVKPILVVYNLKNGKLYESDCWTVNMSVKDNFSLNKVQIFLDDKEYKTWTAQKLQDIGESNSVLTFDIVGNSIRAHEIEIICVDEAGNEYRKKIAGFYVTTDQRVYLWKYKFLICGIVVSILLWSVFIFRIVCKNRRNSLLNFEK